MRFKYEIFINPGLIEGLTIINNSPLPVLDSYKVSNLIERIDEQYKKYEQLRVKQCKQHGELVDVLDDKGKPVKNPSTGKHIQKYNFSEENQKLFDEEIKALKEIEFELNEDLPLIIKLKEEKLDKLEISPGMLQAIKDFIKIEKRE